MTSGGGARMLIADVLQKRPGLSARQIADVVGIDRSIVNKTLYQERSTFRSAGDSPPRWELITGRVNSGSRPQAGRPHPPGGSSHGPRATLIDEANLHDWQREALTAWRDNRCRGIVEAVTGAGKTRIGMVAIGESLGRGGRAAVIVPTLELVRQWTAELATIFPDARIGRMGDGSHDTLRNHDILVATAASARRYELEIGQASGLLVADECHRYGAEQSQLALEDGFERRLGLSATYRRSDGAHESVLEPYFDGVVYELGYRRAIDDGVVAPFRIGLVPVRFTPREQAGYDQLSEDVRQAKRTLVVRFGLPADPFEEFLAAVTRLRKSGSRQEGVAAGRYWSAFTKRRQLLAETPAKVGVLDQLQGAICDAERTIVFTQTIEGAMRASDRLQANGIESLTIHSKLRDVERRHALDRFASGRTRVIVAPQILDEGIDVPAADLAVILAASQQRRQMVQRMGRVLRRKADGRHARFAITYVEGTTEDPGGGAHEAFLAEALDVADDVLAFAPDCAAADLRSYLRPDRR